MFQQIKHIEIMKQSIKEWLQALLAAGIFFAIVLIQMY